MNVSFQRTGLQQFLPGKDRLLESFAPVIFAYFPEKENHLSYFLIHEIIEVLILKYLTLSYKLTRSRSKIIILTKFGSST